MNLKTQEQLVSIINRLNSIAEILYALQMLDNNENEEFNALHISSYLELPAFELEKIKRELEKIID
ncbi:hypothetical protein [uncultured Thomasclavelia sp.]|uniref:hypothetical protein n=1 Tax=uncultured Thomasclavelia sp. TaxID=3025759 RepID=UPI002621935A|nr:hypothetical protein [uncultured Thomasclavelia sp.]